MGDRRFPVLRGTWPSCSSGTREIYSMKTGAEHPDGVGDRDRRCTRLGRDAVRGCDALQSLGIAIRLGRGALRRGGTALISRRNSSHAGFVQAVVALLVLLVLQARRDDAPLQARALVQRRGRSARPCYGRSQPC